MPLIEKIVDAIKDAIKEKNTEDFKDHFEDYLKIRDTSIEINDWGITDEYMEIIVDMIVDFEKNGMPGSQAEIQKIQKKMNKMPNTDERIDKIQEEIGKLYNTNRNLTKEEEKKIEKLHGEMANLQQKYEEKETLKIEIERLQSLKNNNQNSRKINVKKIVIVENNHLTKIPDMSKLNLISFAIFNQKIKKVDASHLPISLTDLRLAECDIEEIKNLSKLTNLKLLYIFGNKMKKLPEMPESINTLFLDRDGWDTKFQPIVTEYNRKTINVKEFIKSVNNIYSIYYKRGLQLLYGRKPKGANLLHENIMSDIAKSVGIPRMKYPAGIKTNENIEKGKTRAIKNKVMSELRRKTTRRNSPKRNSTRRNNM